MSNNSISGFSRRGILAAFAATAVVAAPTCSNAFGLLRGAGDVRRIRMYSGRTGESLDTIYWIEGEYIPEALNEVTYFMRDWRSDRTKEIDPRTIDIAAAAQEILGKRFGPAECGGSEARLRSDAWALEAMVNVGFCSAIAGDLEKADGVFIRLLEYTPDNYEALVGRALMVGAREAVREMLVAMGVASE